MPDHVRDLTFTASFLLRVHVFTRVYFSAAVHICNIEEQLRRRIATDEFGRVALCSVLLLQLIACVMPGSRSSTDPEHKSPRESGEDSEDESEILEESPCGRWLKRREEVHLLFSFFHPLVFITIHTSSMCLFISHVCPFVYGYGLVTVCIASNRLDVYVLCMYYNQCYGTLNSLIVKAERNLS